MQRRTFLMGASILAVAGCAGPSVWAPDDVLHKARYVHPAPPSVTLITVKNHGSDSGAHTALLINGPERVLFDGAGSFEHPALSERNDLIYGMNPAVMDFYIDFQSRTKFYVITQHKLVSAQTADLLYKNAQTAGPVPSAFCASKTSALLATAPEFSMIKQTMFPNKLQAQFAKLDGVLTRKFMGIDPEREHSQMFTWAGQKPIYNFE